MTAAFVLEVDWNNDDDFSDTGENISADAYSIQCRRGKNFASNVTGTATAGKLRAALFNFDGDYSPFNTSSPLYGNLVPGRKVRLRATSPVSETLWTGKVDRIIPQIILKGLPVVILEASGIFINLNVLSSTTVFDGGQTGNCIDSILDDVDWPALDRSIDTGNIEVGKVFFDDVNTLEALRQIAEDCEFGTLLEGLDWDVVFQSRYYRDVNSLTSQATLSDDGVSSLGYQAVSEADHLREIFNDISANIQPYIKDEESVLWSLGSEILTLGAGQSRTYFARVSTLDNVRILYADPWTTPIVGTDLIQTGVSDGDIDVSVSKFAATMKIVITNNGGATSSFSTVQARGIPVLAGAPFTISAEDATSIAAYGRRKFPLQARWIANSAYAEGTVNYILGRQKDPTPIPTIEVLGKDDTHLTQMFQRDISERITLEAENMTKLGINQDFYIEAITHIIEQNRLPKTVWELSPAVDNNYFILDVSHLDGTDVLAS